MITPEQRAKMKEGKLRAAARRQEAEARADADRAAARSTTDMPAGDARREQERVNADHLAREGEERAQQTERERLDPKAFEPDREVRQHLVPFNQLEVTGRLPDYDYCWANARNANGIQVQEKLALRVRDPDSGAPVRVWEVVRGDMPESLENKDETGVRRIADVILLRGRKERVKALEESERATHRAREAGIAAPLEALNQQMAARGLGMRVSVNTPLADPVIRRAAMEAARRGISREQFFAGVADQLKTGGGR